MTLIKSISGIRGTIGGNVNENLTPLDIVKFVSAYCVFFKQINNKNSIVIGRDARISGKMILELSIQTAISLGYDVINLDLSTTPTIEMAVKLENANGGIIITASHNPKQWNALKLLNKNGEFISKEEGEKIIELVNSEKFIYEDIYNLGKIIDKDYLKIFTNLVLNYPLVNKQKIKNAGFKIVVDAINSTGAIYIKYLLEQLGLTNITIINNKMDGNFAHNPEPLLENLTEIIEIVKNTKADLGIAVDPDVDRLCFINENGTLFGEEYTLVAVADYILSKKQGNTVSNLSSTNALKDITEKYNQKYYSSKVGEVNVVEKMKEVDAVIGGEGNGGIIVPDFHYGRDALIGIALFLSHLAEKKIKISELKNQYPKYFMFKTKIEVSKNTPISNIFISIKNNFLSEKFIEEDGLKIIFENTNEWIHIRTSNTEPIIRIYTESPNEKNSIELANIILNIIKNI